MSKTPPTDHEPRKKYTIDKDVNEGYQKYMEDLMASNGRLEVLTTKEDSFARYYAMTGSKEDAFNASEYADVTEYSPSKARALATRLLLRPKIAHAVARYQERFHINKHIDRNFLTRELLWCLHVSKVKGQVGNTRQVLMDIAKLHGLIIDKAEVDTLHRFTMMKDITVNGQALNFDIGDGQAIDVSQNVIDSKQSATPHTPDREESQAVLNNTIDDLI